MIYGLFILSVFYLIGTFISKITGEIIPGSVIGMLVLFLALQLKIINADKLRKTANSLTKNMALFFVPVGVGIMASIHLITDYLSIIILTCIISTLLIITTVALIQQLFEKWK
ncbi:MAG: CidA/LrgA family protein [Marinilabiliaceae bacterium]|nr:CidA/LrgA family protein [Marinilabiliaceae bacterium]